MNRPRFETTLPNALLWVSRTLDNVARARQSFHDALAEKRVTCRACGHQSPSPFSGSLVASLLGAADTDLNAAREAITKAQERESALLATITTLEADLARARQPASFMDSDC